MLIDKSSYDEFISCHEHNEKKRCPFCGNLRTKKHGFIYSRILTNRGRVKRKTQRYLCRECGKTFTYFGTKTR
jgi:transposase-like protein